MKGSVHISDILYLLTKLYTCEVKLKIEDAVHRDIELNRIEDMIIITEPNHKIGVGSHPYLATFKSRLKTHLFSCAFVERTLCYVRTDYTMYNNFLFLTV